MFVCVCHAITDRQIKQEIANGAQDLKDLENKFGVTTDCGKCKSCVEALFEDQLQLQKI